MVSNEVIQSSAESVLRPAAGEEDLLDAVFNTSSLGLHVLESIRDENGQIIDFFIRLANRRSDEIAGKRVSGMRMLHGWPHTKEIGLFERFVNTVETGESLRYDQLYEGDGVRAWFQWLAAKFGDGLYVTIEDISTRKKNEESLSLSASALQSTLDAAPAVIALLDVVRDTEGKAEDFIISAANDALARLSNRTLADIIGGRVSELYPEAFKGDLRNGYLKVFHTGEPLQIEFLYPLVNRWFSISVTRQVNAKGIVIAALDVTEKKKGEAEKRQIETLRALDKLKTEFLSNVSHELRTPLSLILAPLEDLQSSKCSLPQKQKLEIAHRNAMRLKRLVTSLLDFSRIEAGRFDVIFQPTDLREFTAQLIENFRSSFERANLKLSIRLDVVDDIYINIASWEKIVFNLLSNALKFTFCGRVDVLLRSGAKRVSLHVCDTGIGIAEHNVSKIFERFVRIENVKSRNCEGSGIGLALVKELVSLHGGTIKVKSKLAEGSEFIVSIPKGKKHLPAEQIHEFNGNDYKGTLVKEFNQEVDGWLANDRRREVPTSVKKPCILLIDDNSDLRTYIKSVLQGKYHVIEATGGKDAIDLVRNGMLPDLILSDIMMPEVDGYGVLKEVKAMIHRAVPFIFLTAKASEQEKIEGIRSGADYYLTKPFSRNELLAIVDARIRTSNFSS